MACSLYNNNGYGSSGCVHFVKTNSVTVQDGVLILNIPQATYSNKEKVCICIAQAIPTVTNTKTNMMILIQISGRRKKQNIIKQINKTKRLYIIYNIINIFIYFI